MEKKLIKITDLTAQSGLSSRSLRYYEQVGLIKSIRSDFEKYRYYDAQNVERLKQIIVLRKMQIPIKDIIRIYESEDMRIVVETFVSRLHAIDEEVGALTELRGIIDDFLQAMLNNGITKISALPILYEEMEKQLDTLVQKKPPDYNDLSLLSERLAKPVETSIIHLSPMRVISSYLKADPLVSDPEGFWIWVQAQGIPFGVPGSHEQFTFQTGEGDVIILKIADDFINHSPYLDYRFDGGLFATANVCLDEDLGERLRSLVSGFDSNKYYMIDYRHDGSLRHEVLLENLISPDEKRELVSLLVPVKKRLADSALFDKPQEIPPDTITIAEIEKTNPVLWSKDAAMDKLIPINSPHYRVTKQGEAEYIPWISTRVLSTGISVKLPFRVDIVFRIGEAGGQYGHGSNETSIRLYHGANCNYVFGINMENNADERLSQEAICFHQPFFRNYFRLPKRGGIQRNEYNHLTWIVGMKHLAVIINGEIRYCGTDFPYMKVNTGSMPSLPIIVGSDGSITKYFQSIRVSQLLQLQKSKIKEGALTLNIKQSNNRIPIIHRLVTDEYGENYWFNGCAGYVMECLGEKNYDYWFFAGLTGDVFTQHYAYTKYAGDALTSYMMDEAMGGNPVKFVKDTFAKCGYDATYVSNQDLQKNTEMYMRTLVAYIDKGVPVIAWGTPLVGVFVGYEEYGKILLYITGNEDQPERVPLEKILYGEVENSPYEYHSPLGGWIFVGEKIENRPIADIYRESIFAIPQHMNVKTETCCFGPEAFRAWAKDIETGKFDAMKPGEFDTWAHYTNYVCVLATNGCCRQFLEKAQELNPDMIYLEEINRLYQRTAEIWGGDSPKSDTDSLEALGGGFNVTLEVLQDKDKRKKIVAKIREAAACMDEVLRILQDNLNK